MQQNGSIAQLEEHWDSTPAVVGSSPTGVTIIERCTRGLCGHTANVVDPKYWVPWVRIPLSLLTYQFVDIYVI